MLTLVLWAMFGPPPPSPPPSGDQAAQESPPSLSDPTFERDTRAPKTQAPKLQEVPFPLHGGPDKGKKASPPTETGSLTIADLRDPFSPRATRKRRGNQVSALVLPDLRDPFRVRRVRRPKNWIPPQLPGDIRDPFSTEFRAQIHKRRKKAPCTARTEDGVEIQRPNGMRTADAQCPALTPADLRDPFKE